MKFVTFVFLLSSFNIYSCMIFPSRETKLKNLMITEAANEVGGADILNSQIVVEKHEHQMSHTFSDPDLDCPDTDKVKTTTYFEFKLLWGSRSCKARVNSFLSIEPKDPSDFNPKKVLEHEVTLLDCSDS